MKKLIIIASLATGMFAANAHALLTECKISVRATAASFIAELGIKGSGKATCKDLLGNTVVTPLKAGVIGAALSVPGMCEIAADYQAVGAGFALDDVLSALAEVDVMNVGIGGAVNPLGLNVTIGITNIESSCPRLAGAQAFLVRKAGHSKHYTYNRN
jgi:hypothetical protein